MKVEYRILNPEWNSKAYYYAKEYSPYHTLVTQEEYIRDKKYWSDFFKRIYGFRPEEE